MNTIAQKKCRVCNVEKSIEDLPNHKGVIGGKDSRCNRCNSDAVLKWQRENKEKVNKKNKEWADRNKDKKRAYSKKWRSENPGKQKISAALMRCILLK